MGLFQANYQNPSDAGMQYLEQVPGTVTPYYNPYVTLGRAAGRAIAPQYYQMATNPEDRYNTIMEQYEPSNAYQYQADQLNKSMDADAAAGGYTGTAYDQQQQAQSLEGLMAQDQQRYYNNIDSSQRYGLSGGSHLFDVGYTASDTLANILAQNLAQEAGLAYQGANWQNQMKSQRRQNTLGAAGFGYGRLAYALGTP